MLSALRLTPRKAVTQAFNEVRTDGKVRTAALGIVAFKMMQMGWTPQKMAQVLQRVGYDGILRVGEILKGVLARTKFNKTLQRHVRLPYNDWWFAQTDPFKLTNDKDVFKEIDEKLND